MKLAARNSCSGCAACHDACPCGAISMVSDAEGFCYPAIDPKKCISCGRCVAICPSLHPAQSRQTIFAFAARMANDETTLARSSSGGIFSLLARRVLSDGGVVFGAVWNKDWTAIHRMTEDECGLARMRGSKYLQSQTAGVYVQAKREIETGRKVLFSGTPCQVAALRRFLGKDYENLLTVDLICHGVPSPAVWKAYLRQFPETPVDISFRDKTLGWPHSVTRIDSSDGTERKIEQNSFMFAFAYELCNRPSCHQCRTRGLSSGADITLGDFNGIWRLHPEMNDGRGVSCVLTSTPRGCEAFEEIRPLCECVACTYDDVLSGNPSLERRFPPHPLRNEFLRQCRVGDFNRTVARFLRANGLSRQMLRLKQFVNDLRRSGK